MTGHREPWYLDRLRAEIERAAVAEDRRERRGALGRVRFPIKPVLALAAIVAAVVLAIAVLDGGEAERSAAPAPTPAATPAATQTPEPGSPQAILERLDGVYTANVTTSVIAGAEILPTGWWRITIRAADASFVLSSPDNGGDYVHTITGASPHRLAFAPDGNCEVRAQRQDAAGVEFSLNGSLLTLRGASGGCRPIWQLLTSTPWYRSNS
jgi:hypothetical protein